MSFIVLIIAIFLFIKTNKQLKQTTKILDEVVKSQKELDIALDKTITAMIAFADSPAVKKIVEENKV